MADIKDLHGNMRALISRPKSVESDKEEFTRFHPDKVWKLDADVHECASCHVAFGMTTRKHHCRECGDLFCANCSSRQIVIHGTLKRCCNDCYSRAVYDPIRPSFANLEAKSRGSFDRFADDSAKAGSKSTGSLNGWSNSNSLERASFMASSMSGSPGRPAHKRGDDIGNVNSSSGEAVTGRNTLTGKGGEISKPLPASEFQFPAWVEALVYVRSEQLSDSSQTGQSADRAVVCHPAGALPAHMLQDVAETAVLSTGSVVQRGGDCSDSADKNFMFRIRDRSMGGLLAVGAVSSDGESEDSNGKHQQDSERADITSGTLFYNCFVSYREGTHSDTNGYSSSSVHVKHALVIVSRWPFHLLAYYAMFKLDDALNWSVIDVEINSKATAPVMLSSAAGSSEVVKPKNASRQIAKVVTECGSLQDDFHARIVQILSTGYKELLAFPEPQSGQTMTLPFMGEMLQYNIPADLKPTYGHNLSLAAAANSVNLVEKLAPLGLLNHIWELWELVATGKDIVVMGSTAAQASEMVLALASMLSPLGYNGDCRPYMQPKDKDVMVLRKMSLAKQQERRESEAKAREGISNSTASMSRTIRNSSIIVGATDAKVLQALNNFDAVMFLGPVSANDIAQSSQALAEQIRARNAATLRLLTEKDDSFLALYTAWEKNSSTKSVASNGQASLSRATLTVVLHRAALQTTLDRDIVRTIQNMDSFTSMRILGDKLMRDRLSAMTVAFFKPVDSGITLEVAEMRSAAQERARIALEQQKIAQLREAVQEDCGSRLIDARATLRVLKELPPALPWMIPTVILWVLYMVGLYLYLWFKQPLQPILCVILLGVFPEQAPKKFERVLRVFVPLWLLYPLVFDAQGRRKDGRDGRKRHGDDFWERIPSNTPAEGANNKRKSVRINESDNDDIGEVATDNVRSPAAEAGSSKPLSAEIMKKFSGTWKRTKTIDYDKFIMAQGATWIKGRLAANIALEHILTVDDNGTYFRLMERGGPVKTDFTYTADGKTVHETSISEARFKDTCAWKGDSLFIHKLIQPGETYELRVHRYLDDDTHLRVVAEYINFASPDKNITATSFFEKTGPSPYVQEMQSKAASGSSSGASGDQQRVSGADGERVDPGSELPALEDNKSGNDGDRPASLKKTSENTVDFSGVWLRNRNTNYDAILFALGMTHVQRRSALSNKMVLSIAMSSDLQCLKIKETATAERTAKDGSLDGDSESAKDISTETYYEINVQAAGKSISTEIELFGHRYLETATFMPSSRGGGTLRIQQIRRDNFCENIIELSLMPSVDDGEKELCMCSSYRNLKYKDKPQVEAVQVFKRMSSAEIEVWRTRCASAATTSAVAPTPAGQGKAAVTQKVEKAAASRSQPDKGVQEARRALHGAWSAAGDNTSPAMTCKLSLSRDGNSVTISEKIGNGANQSHFYEIDSTDESTAPRSTLQGRTFIETAHWDNDILVITKKAIDSQMTITLRRSLQRTEGWGGVKESMITHTVVEQSGKSTETKTTLSRVSN